MHERLVAYMNQPTPEQVRAAHEAAKRLAENAHSDYGDGTQKFKDVEAIRAALPPLPEPERPKITSARELANVFIAKHTMDDSFYEECVIATRDQIIALLEWELEKCENPDCQGCYIRRRLIHELRKAE